MTKVEASPDEQPTPDSLSTDQECDKCYIEVPKNRQEEYEYIKNLSGSGSFESLGTVRTLESRTAGGGSTTKAKFYLREGEGSRELNIDLAGSVIRSGTLGTGAIWRTFEVEESGTYEFTYNPDVKASIETSWNPIGASKDQRAVGTAKEQNPVESKKSGAVQPQVAPAIALALVSIGLGVVTLTISVSNTEGAVGTGYAIQKVNGGHDPVILESGAVSEATKRGEGSLDRRTRESVTVDLEENELYRFIQTGGAAMSATGLASVDVSYTLNLDDNVRYRQV